MSLRLITIGPGSSLQDLGRKGWQRFGVSVSGPMDWLAHGFANKALNNKPLAPAIEIDQMGLTARAETDCTICVAAPGGSLSHNGDNQADISRLCLLQGDEVTVKPRAGGGWAYLAIAGGFIGQPQLGSISFHRRAGLGGPPLAAGQILRAPPQQAILQAASYPALNHYYEADAPLRLIDGPQSDMIKPLSLAAFMDGAFRLSPRSDRMGYRLSGPALEHVAAADIISEGVAMGSIQVPGDGMPIILMADRQTSGGYPKLGTIIAADLPRLAQKPLGDKTDKLSFKAVSIEDAHTDYAKLHQWIDSVLAAPQPVGPRLPTTDILLKNNLIDGVIADK